MPEASSSAIRLQRFPNDDSEIICAESFNVGWGGECVSAMLVENRRLILSGRVLALGCESFAVASWNSAT